MSCIGCRHWVSDYAPTDRGLRKYGECCDKFDDPANCCGREIENYEDGEEDED